MNLLLVDDHTLFREGLRGLLANISPGVTVHEAAAVDDAVDACRATSFRMVLLDLGLANTSGLDTLDRFRAGVPDVPVVVLSGEQEPRHIRSAIDRGAVGFIPKSHSSDLMIAALRFVLAGASISRRARWTRRPRPPPLRSLGSPRASSRCRNCCCKAARTR